MWAVFAVAAAGTAWCQDLSQKVTYSTVAVPIKKALAGIESLTKVKLDAAMPIQKEIVVIDVKDVTLDDLLKRIGAATNCQWDKDSVGVLRLYRTAEATKAEERAEAIARVTAIRKAIDKLTEPLKKNPVLDAKSADQLVASQADPDLGSILGSGGVAGAARGAKSLFTVGAAQPAGRATARLMALIDPTVLANMESDTRIVYSSRPNRMQFAMGPQAIAVLNTMVQEQAIWAEAYRRKTAGQDQNEVSRAISAGLGASNGPISGTPVKALLCIERQALLEAYDLRLKLYDAQGKEVFQGGQTMLLDSSPLNRIEDLLKDQPASKDPDIELTPESKELLTFFRGLTGIMFGGGAAKAMTPATMAKLRSPDKYDPLSFIHSEALFAAAKAQNANLVAAVPDAVISVNNFMLPGQKLTVQSFLKALGTGDVVNIEVKDGWMVVKPTRPVRQREHRVDRQALARLMAAAQDKGLVPLDALAAYALKNPPLVETELAQLYGVLFLPGAITGLMGSQNWNMLRFYGTLNMGQRDSLGRGPVPFQTFTPAQLDLVRHMAYNPGGTGLQVKSAQPATPNVTTIFGGSTNEPTELLPNGLPPDGVLSLTTAKSTVVRDAGEKQPMVQLFSLFAPEELGAFRALKDDPNIGGMLGSFLPDLAKFRLGTRLDYSFLFQFTPDVSMTQRLQDGQFDPKSAVLSYADLPADFRKKVEDVQEQIKKSGGIPNIFGGGGPAKP